MTKLILFSVIMVLCSANALADISTTDVSKIGDDYYVWKNGTYIRYEKQGNDIYGSDGSHYVKNGSLYNDVAPNGKTYYLNGNTYGEIRY